MKKEIELKKSNLYIVGKGKDTNGNSVLKLKFPSSSRSFSVQTNGNLPETHRIISRLSGGIKGFAKTTEEEIETIEKEVVDYLEKHGSISQKRTLKKWFKNGGGVDKKITSKKDGALEILRAETTAYSVEKYGEPIDDETFMVAGIKQDGDDIKFKFIVAETISGKDIKLTPTQLFDSKRAEKFEGGGYIKLTKEESDRLDFLQSKEDTDSLTKSENEEYEKLVLKYRKTKDYKGNKFNNGGQIKSDIAKLEKLISSDNPMITDEIKEKAKKKIEELKASVKKEEPKSEPIKTFKDSKTGAVYTIEKDPNKDGRFAIYSESKDWDRRVEFDNLVTLEDAIELAMVSSGAKKEFDAEKEFFKKEIESEKQPEEKIKMKHIEILWAEGMSKYVDKFPKKYTSLSELRNDLKPLVEKDGMGYNKAKFRIEFTDGEEYVGRLDISEREDNPEKDENVVKSHILSWFNWMLNDDNTKDETKKEIREYLDKYSFDEFEKESKKTSTKTEKPKFKVGDKVKADMGGGLAHYGVVKSISKGMAFESQNGYNVSGFGDPLKEEQIEKVSDAEYKKHTEKPKVATKKEVKGDLPKSKFEIGDKVLMNGEVYEIKDKSYRNNIDDELTWVYYLPKYSSILVSEKNLKQAPKETKSWKDKFNDLKKKKDFKGKVRKETKAVSGTKSRDVKRDLDRQALPKGKRVSKAGAKNQYGTSKGGNVYYERRSNRSDISSKDKFEKGGEVKKSGWGLNFLKW